MTLISILLPVKNGSQYLEEALLSIQAQTFMDWELLVINDHSGDATAAIVQKFCQTDNRIRLIQNDGTGIIDALKTGYNNARGSKITRMDSDDLMTVDRLNLMAANTTPGQICVGLIRYISKGRLSPGYKRYEKWLNQNLVSHNPYMHIYRECIIPSPNWMITREDLDKTDAFDTIEYPEDYDLVFNWYKKNLQIHTIPHITLLWREHKDRTSRNDELYQQHSFFHLKINRFLEIDWNGDSLIIWGTGKKAKITMDLLHQNNVSHQAMNQHEASKLSPYNGRQLLICVYPKKKERLQIESFLISHDYEIGLNAWYL